MSTLSWSLVWSLSRGFTVYWRHLYHISCHILPEDNCHQWHGKHAGNEGGHSQQYEVGYQGQTVCVTPPDLCCPVVSSHALATSEHLGADNTKMFKIVT